MSLVARLAGVGASLYDGIVSESRVIVKHYHERTKHDFQRYARSLGFLDWSTQPDPFRRFRGTDLAPLLLTRSATGNPLLPHPQPLYDDLYTPNRIPPGPVAFHRISAFFEFSLAISAWKEYRGERWALRINPSSGNLHPTEGYLVIGAVDGINQHPGVYHYAAKEHALEHRCQFGKDIWTQLTAGFPKDTFFAGLSSIHWREAWKYGERAYRYCQHDVGHALAALSLSAACNGWQTVPLDGMSDSAVAALLGLDRAQDFVDVEREQPDLLVAVIPHGSSTEQSFPHILPEEAIGRIASRRWFGVANRLSHDHFDWPIIDEVVRACEKPANHQIAKSANHNFAGDILRRAVAHQIIFQRRSALAFDGRTGITAEQFYLMLDRTLPRFDRSPWSALGPPICTHLALFVHRVSGLDPGLYFLVRDPAQISGLREATNPQFAWKKPESSPASLPLFVLGTGDVRQVASHVSCHQDIAGDGAFSMGMIVEFDQPLQEFGAWFYRRLFWETGVIGQVLYLEAEAAGIRSTGIGCFFDDPVHHLLGLSGTAYQSFYHFTVGGHVEDKRLTTLPPYPGRSPAK